MKKTVFLLLAFTLLAIVTVRSQTKDEAGLAYNAVLEQAKTDVPGAILKMQDVVKMCTTVGAEADDLKKKAQGILPKWQYNVSNNLLKDKKNDEAQAAYEKTIEFAVVAGDNEIKDKAENQLAKIYALKGNMAMKEDKMDDAIAFFDKSLQLDTESGKVLYAKGQAYKKKGDFAKMQENLEKAIEIATKSNDTALLNTAKKSLVQNLMQNGKALYQKKAYAEAIAQLNVTLKYDDKNKEAFYLIAVASNNLKKFDDAIDFANKGLLLEETTNEKMARFYYEIAKAFEGKQDATNACANYKKAAFGTYAQSANYQMKTVLKCK
jgi:tetratricopeptide (TPR) repeat protein